MNTRPLLFEDPILTVPEVAHYLKMSKSKIYYLVSRKKIPHLKVGRNVRIRVSDLQTWMNLQVEKVPQTLQHLSPER